MQMLHNRAPAAGQGKRARTLPKHDKPQAPVMPEINQQASVLKEFFSLSLTIGELLACTEASTIFYMENVKEYIKMKETHREEHPAMREKLWLIVHTKSGMEKFQNIIEGVRLSTLIEYREFQKNNSPPL